jgi:hypothetical protein
MCIFPQTPFFEGIVLLLLHQKIYLSPPLKSNIFPLSTMTDPNEFVYSLPKSDGWIRCIPPNRKFVEAARAAGSIQDLVAPLEAPPPAKRKKKRQHSSDEESEEEETPQVIDEELTRKRERALDGRIPRPEELTNQCMVAYSWWVYYPELPPNTKFATWAEYNEYVDRLTYRSIEWNEEHNKYFSASSLGKALGLHNYITPEKFWAICRGLKEPITWFGEYMKLRGLHLEDFVHALYLCVAPGVTIRVPNTLVNPHMRFLMATPDLDIFDAITGELLRRGEIKCPMICDAFHSIPPEHMAQIQFAMWATNTTVYDYMSFKVDDRTLDSTFIIHRVMFSEEYIRMALPIIRAFCRAVLTGTTPPRRGSFKPPAVETEQILYMEDVVSMIEDGTNKVRTALGAARAAAADVVAKNAIIATTSAMAPPMFDNEMMGEESYP